MHFHVLCTPGHSQGSVCLLCGDLLFSGDTLFCGDIGRTDLSGGSEQQMRHSLARLWDAVPDDTQVLPGHDVFSTMAQEKQTNAYLKAARGSV
jgi:glyoxylase-like metal-dependent hydrolase (beta-lactamase superfamily II)